MTLPLRNWAGNIVFAADRVESPRTVEELQPLVAGAQRVRALGSGHSFNRVADTTGLMIDLSRLDVEMSIDASRATVRVGPGVRYAQLCAYLDDHGWALANLGSLPHISVAGACATGTHGSGNANTCLADAVRAVELVRADGELVRMALGDADFGGAVVALGAIGVVSALEVAIEPAYEVRQDVFLDAAVDAVAERIDELLACGYSVSLFLDPARPGVVDKIWVKSRGRDGPDLAGLGRRATEPMHPIPGLDASRATTQLGEPGPWHARLPHFRAEYVPSAGKELQSEFLLPREHAASGLLALQSLDPRGSILTCEIRTVAADRLWLSPCHDRDTVAVHVTWVREEELVAEVCAALEATLAPFDPRPHWAKVFTMPASQVRAHYPRLPDFQRLAAQHDPERHFGNQFLQKFIYD